MMVATVFLKSFIYVTIISVRVLNFVEAFRVAIRVFFVCDTLIIMLSNMMLGCICIYSVTGDYPFNSVFVRSDISVIYIS